MGGTQENINPDAEGGVMEQETTDTAVTEQAPDSPGKDENGDGLKGEAEPPSTPGDVLNI